MAFDVGQSGELWPHGTIKGVAPRASVRVADVGRQGSNVRRDDLPLPAAVVRDSACGRIQLGMQDLAAKHGVRWHRM